METTAAPREYSEEKVLFLALELSNSKWKLGSTVGVGSKARERTIAAGDLGALHEEVSRAKRRFGLESSARVVSCYEAGRDGFWLDRHLRHAGIENIVVDPSSIEVNRRSRRAKTERLDVGKLLRQLMRWWSGGPKVSRSFLARLSAVRLWDNSPVPAGLRSRLEREYVRWTLVQEQIAELEKQRRSALRTATVEIAWGWLRFQPDSELSNWFQERYGPGSRRSRRVGIVALARKLLIALWRYLETGVVSAGAVLKT